MEQGPKSIHTSLETLPGPEIPICCTMLKTHSPGLSDFDPHMTDLVSRRIHQTCLPSLTVSGCLDLAIKKHIDSQSSIGIGPMW